MIDPRQLVILTAHGGAQTSTAEVEVADQMRSDLKNLVAAPQTYNVVVGARESGAGGNASTITIPWINDDVFGLLVTDYSDPSGTKTNRATLVLADAVFATFCCVSDGVANQMRTDLGGLEVTPQEYEVTTKADPTGTSGYATKFIAKWYVGDVAGLTIISVEDIPEE